MGEVFFKRVFLAVLFTVSFILFSVICFAAVHPLYSSFSSAESGFVFNNNTNLVSVSDTVVYQTGYYSINGSDWQSFNLTGTFYPSSNSWLTGLSTKTLFNFGAGEHYIIVYSCNYSGSWNCHNNSWQLQVINPPSCTDGIQNQNEAGIDCGGSCASCPASENSTTILQQFTNNSSFASVSSATISNGVMRVTAGTQGLLNDSRLVSVYLFENANNLGLDAKNRNNMVVIDVYGNDPARSTDVPSGKTGYSMDLDGDDQTCISSGFTFNPSLDHTMCFWAKKRELRGDGNVFAQNCYYDTWGAGNYQFTANNCEGSQSFTTNIAYTLNTWTNICQTYDASARYMEFYVGGVKVDNHIFSTPIIYSTSNGWCIGGCSGGCYMNGLVYQPAWFNSILSSQEIAGIYNGSLSNGGSTSGTATSQVITAAESIANITNLTYTLTRDNTSSTATVEFSFDNGVTWYALSSGGTLQNPGASNSLIYRVTLLSLTGNTTIDNLQFTYTTSHVETECSSGQTMPCGSDIGACAAGVLNCVSGFWSNTCVGQITPTTEVCNSVDDDCDGQTNEGLSRQTTCGVGRCAGNTGTETCNAQGSWIGNTCNAYANAITEICNNGIDDDCDGLTDGADAVDCPLVCNSGDGQCPAGCTYAGGDTDCVQSAAIIADHNAAIAFDRGDIPVCWIEKAKTLTFQYAHRSDGNNIFEGLGGLYARNSTLRYSRGANYLPDQTSPIGIRMMDGNPLAGSYGVASADSYGYIYSNLYWSDADARARTYNNLNARVFNYSMWSWCDENTYQSIASTQFYLDTLNSMEPSYTNGKFIYMTSFAENSNSGNVANNELIRNYALNNKKILYDFEDIGKYDPAGTYYPGADRSCTWCTAWCASHPSDCVNLPGCSHADAPNGGFVCIQRGKAFWWLMARLAGWNGLPAGAGANACS